MCCTPCHPCIVYGICSTRETIPPFVRNQRQTSPWSMDLCAFISCVPLWNSQSTRRARAFTSCALLLCLKLS